MSFIMRERRGNVQVSKTPSTKIKVSELARRITGFSVPGFGLQWSPPDNERKTIRALLTGLIDTGRGSLQLLVS